MVIVKASPLLPRVELIVEDKELWVYEAVVAITIHRYIAIGAPPQKMVMRHRSHRTPSGLGEREWERGLKQHLG